MSETGEKVRYRCEGCGEAVPERDVVVGMLDARHPVQVEDGDVDFCGPVRPMTPSTAGPERGKMRCGGRKQVYVLSERGSGKAKSSLCSEEGLRF